MKRDRILAFALAIDVMLSVRLCSGLGPYALFDYDPIANPASVVAGTNYRFTVLTDRMIRMEYQEDGKFEDQATVTFLNRNLPTPYFTTSSSGETLTIQTQYLTLSYQTEQPFTKSTLQISSNGTSSFHWAAHQPNDGNLLGTIRSLDNRSVLPLNCTENRGIMVHNESLHCAWGLISRDGWAVVDDSLNWALSNSFWWDHINQDTYDWYMLGYGSDYKAALRDFTTVAGKIPMWPRYATGVWWSRWYNYDARDSMKVLHDYESRNIPLDVYVYDMDWHSKEGWGGYSFDRRLFPIPSDSIGEIKNKGLAVTVNLHDADGVRPTEIMYDEMCAALNIDPALRNTIPFDVVNSTYMYSLEDIVLQYVKDQGVDFWWIDWQQGGRNGGCQGGKQNPTIALNAVRGTDNMRTGVNERALILARWGGLGNHRYQVGFSGDVVGLTWKHLAFQPYFSSTATNVGFGWWSNDIMGPPFDHELHTRWLQWGAYSGVFRTHDRGRSSGECANIGTCDIVRLYNVPLRYYDINRETAVQRQRMVPYIYNAMRQSFDTGLSILRPMYYEYPHQEMAYSATPNGNFPQYFFGDDMFVSPVVVQAGNDGMAEKSVWIPPGEWFEKDTGVLHLGANDGSTVLKKKFDLSEIPVFIRAGAVIPNLVVGREVMGLAGKPYSALEFAVYPSSNASSCGGATVYEDDAISNNYLNGSFAYTIMKYTRSSTQMSVHIYTDGTYPSLPSQRRYLLSIYSTSPPLAVTVNGLKIGYTRHGGSMTWSYDGTQLRLIVDCGNVNVSTATSINLSFSDQSSDMLNGVKGVLQHALLAKQNLDESKSTPGTKTTAGGYLDVLVSSAQLLTVYAGSNATRFSQTLQDIPLLFSGALKELQSLRKFNGQELLQLWNQDKLDSCLCGTQDCIRDNYLYRQLRIEGYQASNTTNGAIPLRQYYSSEYNDHLATTSTTAPPGYKEHGLGIGKDGYVLSQPLSNTRALKLYFSQDRNDHVTVASPEGIRYAESRGYVLQNATLGYVFISPQSTPNNRLYVDQSRLSYSLALMESSAFVDVT